MKVTIQTCPRLQGKLTPPASKSEAIRALFFALLSPGESLIHGLSDSEDLSCAREVITALGARLHFDQNTCLIRSQGLPLHPLQTKIFTGDSGLTTRFTLPLLGLRANSTQVMSFDCGEQMRSRPMNSLMSALSLLGMKFETQTFPLRLSGTLQGGEAEISGLTSQFLSALLIALPLAEKPSLIRVRDLNERPYVDMTLKGLMRRGIQFKHEQRPGLDLFEIPGGQRYEPLEYTVPKDYSGAASFLAAGALIPGELILEGLDLNDNQGDKRLLEILESMGAELSIHPDKITLRGGKKLRGLTVDARDIPDLLPTLAVLGTAASTPMIIHQVPQARLKETDRIHSMSEGLRALGARVEEKPDGLIIYPSALTGACVNGYGDHRTVMALSLAGLIAQGVTQITQAESVDKTYPQFFEVLGRLGATLEVSHDDI